MSEILVFERPKECGNPDCLKQIDGCSVSVIKHKKTTTGACGYLAEVKNFSDIPRIFYACERGLREPNRGGRKGRKL